jgi:hypothetical protein
VQQVNHLKDKEQKYNQEITIDYYLIYLTM